jgi:diacylglycerol O-acyltransferase
MTEHRSGDRLTALDAAFYHLEHPGQLLHVGGIYTTGGPIDHRLLCEDIEARLPGIPRYLQRVVPVPLTLGHPTWEADPTFEIDNHVRRHVLRAPGDDTQLAALAGRIFAEPLARDRPLWELHLVEGYQGSAAALVAKVHHCMIDGVSGVQLMSVLFDVSPNPGRRDLPAPLPEPPPPPRPLAQATRALWESGETAWRRVRGTTALLRRPAGALAAVREGLASLARLGRVVLQPPPATPYNGHVSGLRRVAWRTLSLNEVKSVKNRLGGTVNDVILTIIAAALRRDLEARGIEPDGLELRAMCPVNVRRPDEHLALGNRVSMMFGTLPVGIYDPLERFRQVRATMGRLKREKESDHVARVLDLVELIPAGIQVPLAQLQLNWVPINTICTNVPGPPVSLYVQGQRLETLVPLVPLAQGVGLAFAILSYADTITIGIVGDPALVGDVAPIADGIAAAHAELCGLAGLGGARERRPALGTRPARVSGPSRREAS